MAMEVMEVGSSVGNAARGGARLADETLHAHSQSHCRVGGCIL